MPDINSETSAIIDRLTNAPTIRTEPLTRGELGAIVGVLNDVGGSDEVRRLVLLYVFGSASI